jgi:hypothetical protein
LDASAVGSDGLGMIRDRKQPSAKFVDDFFRTIASTRNKIDFNHSGIETAHEALYVAQKNFKESYRDTATSCASK